MGMLTESAFWVALSQIMLIDLVLAGDNAVVIALACRNLPQQYRRKAIIAGSAGAILLRFFFVLIIAWLLLIPFLKIVGGLLLLWIGIKLIAQEEGGEGENIAGKATLWGAIQTIIIADAVMSLDNAIGIAAAATKAAGGDETRAWTLIIVGLMITIPIIVFGSAIVLRIMQRFPIVIVLGGGLLGFLAGEMMVTDPAIHRWVEALATSWFSTDLAPGSEPYAAWLKARVHYFELACGALGAALVLVIGLIVKRRAAAKAHAVVDLAAKKG